MTTYEPGTVAVATVRGVEGVRVMRDAGGGWWSPRLIGGGWKHLNENVTDIRPLAVIDPEDREQVERLADALRGVEWCEIDRDSTDALQVALCEYAAPTPERIPEPGIWGVVEARSEAYLRTEWVRRPDDLWHTTGERRREWDELIDPVLVRPGVGDE